ncbi:MAG TPA: AraC family transcriptional regulator [Steroidobacteraceae bacterium]|nr:AraC family transcriptional regulator [Steroidobacteraceae bacterium]
MSADGVTSIQSLRAYVEGYPEGGRIERHAHDLDQLTVITRSAAVVETDDVYVVHPCMHALWLPAGVEHSIFSPRPYYLHALYFVPRTVRTGADAPSGPQVLGLNNLARELVLFLCEAPRLSQRGPRHAHALTLLTDFLADAKVDSFSLPRPRGDRARKLADYLTTHPSDSRSLEIVAAEIGGASLRTFERSFLDETGLNLAVWRRQSRLLTSLTLLAEGKSVGEVARAVGYESAAAFSTAFKQCFGVSPSNYASNGG